MEKNKQDKINIAVALAVFFVSLITYLRTVQPTVPYWDCGEFIACAHILGIPHPPGTPLFVVIGRVFSMLIPFGEVAWRVNLISAVSSAFAVMFGYLVTAWIIRKCHHDSGNIYTRASSYIGGAVGALFLAFSRTFWGNAVEAEVYGISMLIMMASIFLVFKWVDNRKEASGERYLCLLAFLSVLALGIHMTSFLVVPAIFLFMLAIDRNLVRNWQFILTFILLNIIPVSVTLYLVLSALWVTVTAVVYFWNRIREGWIYTVFLPVIIFLFLISMGYSWIPILLYCLGGWSLLTLVVFRMRPGKKVWRLAFMISLMGLLGFSAQLYTPIRSFSDPAIDMNNPETWKSVRDFLERKQYGSESMFTRMLHRRGTWVNQFGNHERMGFWGFFHEQYSPIKWFWLLFPLGMFGGLFVIRQRWRLGTFMFLILLISTVGLVLYMNFSDGTLENKVFGVDHLEVRDRDYFFTPGFMLFGMFIGLGVAGILSLVFKFFEKKNISGSARIALIMVCALPVLLPVLGYSHNYYFSDRSRNYLPFNYALNILNSCRPNAILFTNGDNDTFPVWCIQRAYGIRPDVRVMVLSLMRADWYVKHYRDKFGVPVSYRDDEFALLRPKMVDNQYYSISNIIVDNIIDNIQVKSTHPGQWPDLPMTYIQFLRKYGGRFGGDTTLYFDPPVQFATTVDNTGYKYREKPIDLSSISGVIEGLVYNMSPVKLPNKINADFTSEYFLNVFDPTGVTDERIYKDDNATRLAENYWRVMAKMADEVFAAGKWDEAVEMNWRSVLISVSPVEAFRFLAKNLKKSGRLNELEYYIRKVENASEEDLAQISCRMLDILFALDMNEIKKELLKEGQDQVTMNNRIAEQYITDPQYEYYLGFLDEYAYRYPHNELFKAYIDRANSSVLKFVPFESLQKLNLRFLGSTPENINGSSGG